MAAQDFRQVTNPMLIRQIILCALYTIVAVASFVAACVSPFAPTDPLQVSLRNLVWLLPIKLLVLAVFGQFRSKLTLFNRDDAAKLALVAVTSGLLAFVVSHAAVFGPYLPPGIVVADGLFYFIGLFALRLSFAAYRVHHDQSRLRPKKLSEIHRRDHLVDWIQQLDSRRVLEIGPFDCPLIQGPDVKYFDVIDQAGLTARAVSIGRTANLHNIPVIHYVDPEGNLRNVTEKFALCVSSHVIEHQPDVVRHLQDVSSLLQKDGMYALLIPDKRYCFDHFIAESTIADALDAHLVGRTMHSPRAVIEHRALTCHNDAARHWRGDHGPFSLDARSVRAAVKQYNESLQRNEYVDVHAWQFTPRSFRKLIDLLSQLDYIDLQVDHIGETPKGQLEFCAVLKKQDCRT